MDRPTRLGGSKSLVIFALPALLIGCGHGGGPEPTTPSAAVAADNPTPPAASHATPGAGQPAPRGPTPPPPPKPPEPTETVAVLTADELYEQHQAGRDGLMRQFKGGLVEVKGVVRDINHFDDAVGMSFAFKASGTTIQGIPCELKGKYHGNLTGVVGQGQTVTVRGVYDGGIAVIPVLRECDIVSRGAEGAPEAIDSSAVLKDFPQAVDKIKARGVVTFIVTGKVHAVAPSVLELSDDGKSRVRVSRIGGRNWAGNPKVGDQVTVVGDYEWADRTKKTLWLNHGLAVAP